MRKIALLLSFVVLCTLSIHAQTVATFESLTLPGTDTFYINTTASMTDQGFNNGLAHFPYYYDTSFGGYWDHGFAYSNKTDSVTSGFTNMYSAKTAIGYNGSSKYVVAYGGNNKLKLTGTAMGKPVSGFYITNSTYAYNSMRDGDGFAKKFGGTTGNDSDWFKLTIKGYRTGTLTTDSVNFYLADFRFTNNAQDYIVKTWQWVDLLPLGVVDSLHFTLSSSDTGTFGMNTPAYFCMDNFTTFESFLSVGEVNAPIAKVYPIPATDKLYVESIGQQADVLNIIDTKGAIVATFPVTGTVSALNIATLPTGTYVLQLIKDNHAESMRFVKY